MWIQEFLKDFLMKFFRRVGRGPRYSWLDFVETIRIEGFFKKDS